MVRHGPLVGLLLLLSCAQVPAGVCFSDEPCADAGSAGGGGGSAAGGGGSATGGGDAAGGGSATGGGGNPTGGGAGGGDPNQPITPRFSSLGIADTWGEVVFAAPQATPPTFIAREVTLTPAISSSNNCHEAFRGAVALPDGRVLAIPFCANRFAVIDPGTATAEWIGPTVTFMRPPFAELPGSYGGGVFGCDGRVYALPHFDETAMMRITPEEDGGFTFDELPLSMPGPHRLSGGVIARPCTAGFRIIAAGRGGLFVLDPTEGAVAVTLLAPPLATTRTFVGVARLGDDRVVSTPAENTTDFVSLWVDSNTLDVAVTIGTNNPARRYGLASLRAGGAFAMTETGVVFQEQADGGIGGLRSIMGSRLRWPTNSLTGWVFAAGEELVAFNEATPPPSDAVLFSPAVSDVMGFTSGGLVLSTSGELVSVPAKTGRSVITLYTPVPSATLEAGVVLSPWFNKL